MQTVDKYELIRILKEPNLKTFTLNTVLYAIERATIKAKSVKRRRLTDEEKHDYIDRTERRKFDSICTACESLCFATDNYCGNCGAILDGGADNGNG